MERQWLAKERRYVGKMNELRGFGCKRTQKERESGTLAEPRKSNGDENGAISNGIKYHIVK